MSACAKTIGTLGSMHQPAARFALVIVLSLALSSVAEVAGALRAPKTLDSSKPAYYYVSDDISENGLFPITWVGFYWESPGQKTIAYNPRKCNNGGYEDSTDGDPRLTIYALAPDGAPDRGTVLKGPTSIDRCHDGNSNTNFTFSLDSSSYDSNIGMYGVAVRVDSKGSGASRAWFSLETKDTDGADFGVLKDLSVGYSRDFTSGGGDYYDLQTGFGSCNLGPMTNQAVSFFDTDRSKYQNIGWDDNALRIRFSNLTVDPMNPTPLRNDSRVFSGLTRISRRDRSTTFFNLTANSGEAASLRIDMAANTGYRLDIKHLREGNDITVKVPTNEIYGKIECRDWAMSGHTTVSAATASPGKQVTFTHYVKNTGPSDSKVDVSAETSIRASAGAPAAAGMQAMPAMNLGLFAAKQEKTAFTNTITIPPTALDGQEYCEQVAYTPKSSNNTSKGSGEWACVTVQSNYELYPRITIGGSTNVVPVFQDDSQPVQEDIYRGGGIPPQESPYEVYRFTIPAAAVKPAFGGVFSQTATVNGVNITYATGSYGAPGAGCGGWLKARPGFGVITNCQLLYSNDTTTFVNPSTGMIGAAAPDITASGGSMGDMICQFIAMRQYSSAVADPASYRLSLPACVVIAKQPSVQIWGGDMRVGNNYINSLVNGNASVATGKYKAKNTDGIPATFGSWVEYGIFAPAPNGIIQSVSGGAVSGAKGLIVEPTSDAELNTLSFSNTEPGYFGKWEQARQIDSIESFAANYDATANYAGADLPLDAAYGLNDGDIKRVPLTAATITVHGDFSKNATAILVSHGTVTITGDIKVTQPAIGSIGTAAQVVIIADNIVIKGNVKQIDAWLVARPTDTAEPLTGANGKISTCDSIMQPPSNYYDGLKLGECNQPLKINGAMIAKEVQFRRTYGSDKAVGLGAPAEIINLRADAFMWARPYSGAGAGMPIKTMTITELPPRF